MHFQVKMPETGTNNIFRGKKTTNKISPMFLDIEMLAER